MSQIVLITRFGKKECVPFAVNEAPNNFEQEDIESITESPTENSLENTNEANSPDA